MATSASPDQSGTATAGGGDLLVGLDVGTTSAKAVVHTADGTPVATGSAATPWRTTRGGPHGSAGPDSSDGWDGAEVDVHDLDRAVLDALAEALRGAPPGRVAALGVTSMGESGVLLDGRGEPVAPVVAWHDDRDLPEVAELAEEVGADAFALATGLPLRRQWSLTKHRHALRAGDGTARAVRRLNVAERVVALLGGDEVSDLSLASRTGWLDLVARDWWPEGLAFSGAPTSLLPPLTPSGSDCGRARGAVLDGGLERLRGAVLTTAGHDHQAAALGAGAAGPGAVLDSSGTAEALVRTGAPALAPQDLLDLTRAGVTVGWHVVPGAWCLLGATEGGLHLQRVLAGLGAASARPEHLAALDAAGLATWREAADAVTSEAAALLAVMDAAAGPHERLVVTGGWARSADVVAAKRRHLGPLELRDAPEDAESGTRGAALLAGRAARVLDAADTWTRPTPSTPSDRGTGAGTGSSTGGASA